MGKLNYTITLAKARESIGKLWFTQKDAAQYLGVSVRTISRLRESGELPYSQLDKVILIRKDDIDRMVENHRVY